MPGRIIHTLLVLIFLTGFNFHAKGYVFYGAEINYSYVNYNNYNVVVNIFAPCAALPGSTEITVTDGISTKKYTVSYCCASDITPVPKGQCDYCQNNTCSFTFGIKKYQYSASVDLSIFKGCQFKISWTACCGDSLSNSAEAKPSVYVSCQLNRCSIEPSSPKFLFNPVIAVRAKGLTDNFQVVTPANSSDSVVYKLVPPQSDASSPISYAKGFDYLAPMSYAGAAVNANKPFGFHYDLNSGELWFTPQNAESSWICLEADEYTKDGNGKYYLLGSTMRMHMIRSFSYKNNTGKVPVIERTDGSNSDTIIGCGNIPITFSVKAYDPDGDSVGVEQYSEPPGGISFTAKNQYFEGDFKWTPSRYTVSNHPYKIIVTVKDHEKPVYNSIQRTFYLFVKDTMPTFSVSAGLAGCGTYIFATTKPIDTAYHIHYQWHYDSVPISTAASGTYKNSLTGVHNISLKVTNTSGCSATSSAPVYFDTALQKLPAVQGLCFGDKITLHPAIGTNLSWTPATGLSDPSIANPVASPTTTTTYTVSGKDSSGCAYKDQETIYVSNYNIKTSGDISSCPGLPIKLWATYIDGAGYDWQPESLTTNVFFIDTVIAIPQKTTKFLVTINDKGCIRKDSLMVNINPPSLDLGSALTVCPGDSFMMHTTPVKGATYQWFDAQHNIDFPGAISTSYLGTASSYKPNGMVFGLKMTDSIGCTALGYKNINIKMFTPSHTGNTYICQGDTSRLKLHGGNKFSWNGPGFSSGAESIKITPLKTSHFKYSITDTVMGCSLNDSVNVYVNARPSLAMHNTSICQGDNAVLDINGGTIYSWSPSYGLNNNYSASVIANPDKTTTYYVKIVDLSDNCTQTDSIIVHVNDCVWPGDANKDGTADYLDVLYIGVGAGTKGPARDSGTIQWQRYQAKDWPQSTGTGINFKHLDCNGDGIINAADTAIVSANHQAKPFKYADHSNPADPPVYFKFTRDTFYGGETAVAYLYAGTGSHSLTNAYGIAYQVSFKADSVVQGSAWFTPVCDYFCNGSEIQYQALPYVPQSFVHTTVATNGAPSKNTAGQVAVLKFNLKDTLAFDYKKPKKIYANILTVRVIDNNGNIIGVYNINDSAVVARPKRIKTKPLADFVSNRSDCEPLTVKFKENASDSGGNIIKYEWDFGDGSPHSFLPDPVHNYRISNGSAIQEYNVRLTVMDDHGYTNEVTKAKWIVVLGSPKPVIAVNPVMTTLDNPTIHFYISPQSANLDTLDPVTTYEWHFGDVHNPDEGGHSTLMSPEYTYSDTGTYTIRLKVTNNIGCTDSAITTGLFYIKRGFSVFIPNVFIPNGRSKNEVFKPVISACPSYEIMIFNRWNQLVFESKSPDTGWDGNLNGGKAPEGVYFYQIKATNLAGKEFEYKGNVTLIR